MNPLILSMVLLLQSSPADSVIAKIGIDQKLNAAIDRNIPFVDETGRAVLLGDYFGRKPVILTPVYYSCPMLCSELLNGFVRALRVMPFTAGNEFEIVTFSIDPAEKPELAASKKAHYLRDYDRRGAEAGWHFLTGPPESVNKLAEEIGFRYTYDNGTRQWAHASTIVVLTPDGRLSQYWNGIEFEPRDLRLSLVQASNGAIGSIVDHVLLYCYQYDATTGRYSLAVMRVVQLCSIVTLLALGAFIWSSWRKTGGMSPQRG
jgi:protein SCO1